MRAYFFTVIVILMRFTIINFIVIVSSMKMPAVMMSPMAVSSLTGFLFSRRRRLLYTVILPARLSTELDAILRAKPRSAPSAAQLLPRALIPALTAVLRNLLIP